MIVNVTDCSKELGFFELVTVVVVATVMACAESALPSTVEQIAIVTATANREGRQTISRARVRPRATILAFCRCALSPISGKPEIGLLTGALGHLTMTGQ